jgi:hypothetical protein
METIAELYGIIVKEYLKTSMDYENIAKSKESLHIIHMGFNIITNVFRLQCMHALDTIYKMCKEAILIYLEYIDQHISMNKFTLADTINANIFIFNKLIKTNTNITNVNNSAVEIRSSILNMSRLCGLIFDWTNPKYMLEDRNAIAETLLSGYIELFASMDKFGVIIASLELLREKYGALDLPKFQVYLKELYYVLKKNEVTKDRFEIYAMICNESCENKYRELLLTEDKMVFRKFFINVFS